MQLVLITPDRVVAPFLQVIGQDSSELTGVAFDPSGRHLYFSSQRGLGGAGGTYEVRGPFRDGERPERPTSTLAGVAAGAGKDDEGGGGSDVAVPVVAGVGAAVAGAVAWGVHRSRRPPAQEA
jgi:hypothetical protein